MSGPLGEFLAAQRENLAARLGTSGDRSAGERAMALVDGVIAGVDGDVEPLLRVYKLDDGKQQAGSDQRLDLCLHRISSVAAAATELANGAGPNEVDALLRELAEQIPDLCRRVSVTVLGHILTTPPARTNLSITMHELRRPLTILSSYGQLLATGVLGPLPETANIALEGISASTEMMVRMVNALAEVSRLEDPDDRLTVEELHFDDLITAAVEQVGMEAQLRDVEIRREVPANGVVAADRRRVVLALTNLLSNAVKHTPEHSEVLVRAETHGPTVHFTVVDRGPGFPDDDSAKLFEKYFRSIDERKRKIPGSGLGLYIVRTVAERHNGAVNARNGSGGGAEFELVLPARRP